MRLENVALIDATPVNLRRKEQKTLVSIRPERVKFMPEMMPDGVHRIAAEVRDVIYMGPQPSQLLADGEVAMTTGHNGRFFAAKVCEGMPFKSVFDGPVYEYGGTALRKGAPNMEPSIGFLQCATTAQALADQAEWISYGLAGLSSGPLVGLYQDGKTETGPYMPASAENLTNALGSNFELWADRDAELN